jgi:diaminopimelate epimerase
MIFDFIKLQAAGNDFVVIDARQSKDCVFLSAELAKSIAHRKFGIGCDQILIVEDSNKADIKIVIYNSDGSTASACINGTRSVAWLYLDESYSMSIEVGNKILLAKKFCGTVKLEMDMPTIDQDLSNYLSTCVQERISAVSCGNCHAVLLVDCLEYKTDAWLEEKVMQINKAIKEKTFCNDHNDETQTNTPSRKDFGAGDTEHRRRAVHRVPLKPSTCPTNSQTFCDGVYDGCNVEFVQVLDRNNISMYVFERGSGRTLSCGSGAVACAFVVMKHAICDQSVKIHAQGGEIYVEIQENKAKQKFSSSAKSQDSTLKVFGKVNFVFAGKFAYNPDESWPDRFIDFSHSQKN